MPVYVLKCKNNHKFDKYLPLKEYNDPQVCECGAEARRITVPTMLNCDIQPWDAYVSPSTGEYITSYKQRKADMKKSGCVDYDPSMRTEADRIKRNNELKLDKDLDKTVDQIFESMPSSKQEMLERELTNGVDLEYTRGTSNG